MRTVYIHQGILDDDQFDELSDRAQLAFFRLRLSPRVGISGLGRLSKKAILSALRCNEELANQVLDELAGKPWVRQDASGVLWIVGAYRLEPNSWQLREAALKELEQLPPCEILTAWMDRYGRRWTHASPGEQERRAGVESRLADEKDHKSTRGSYTVSIPHRKGIDTSLARVARARSPDRTGPDRKGRSEDGPSQEGEREGTPALARPPRLPHGAGGGRSRRAAPQAVAEMDDDQDVDLPNQPLSDEQRVEAARLRERLRKMAGR